MNTLAFTVGLCGCSLLLGACGAGSRSSSLSAVGGNKAGGGSSVATHLLVTVPPSATVGTAFNLTVTALDPSNNSVTKYVGTVHFMSSDLHAVLPPDSVLANGTMTFSVTLMTAGSQTITATDTVSASVTGTSKPIAVSPVSSVLNRIQHVVVIFQENRTPDNLFHDPVLIANGADIASSGLDSSGATIPLTATPLGVNYDLDHRHSAFVAMYDGGKMDGADKVGAYNNPSPPPNPQFKYVQASDVTPYFLMAEQYTFGDRMFQTNQGPSFPAHQFIISGTSAPTATSNLFAAENPNGGAGCASAPGSKVALIDPDGIESSSTYPCFEHPALTDELDAKGLSWRYYTPNGGGFGDNAGGIWTAPNAIQHLCGPNATPPNATTCMSSSFVSNVVSYTAQNPAPILTDIFNKRLPAVSWVIPAGQNSDHAGVATFTGGPSWVASIVNAIGNSSYWSNTAIIITWDDWGGWYDHVPPPEVSINNNNWGSGYIYGFRVPLIVVSPYAKARYISHVTHDFGSILNFIEQVFNLSSLGFADAHADDLSDCFNFNQAPLQFQKIPAPMSAAHFLNDRTPAADPDDE
jgi:phospholipase C